MEHENIKHGLMILEQRKYRFGIWEKENMS